MTTTLMSIGYKSY